MSRVTEIGKTRYGLRVALDDGQELRLHKKALEELPLARGDEIEPAEYLNRLSARLAGQGMEAALYMLEGGDRTERQMRDYLARHCYPPACVDAVVARLREQGLIDDAKYAQRYAETHPAAGKYAVRRKLLARGVDAETSRAVAEALDDDGQLAAARKEAEKLARRYAGDAARDRYRKSSQALARRGFSWDVIRQALGEPEDEDTEPDGIGE